MIADLTTAGFFPNCHAAREASPPLTSAITTRSSQRFHNVDNKTAAPSGPEASAAPGSESRYVDAVAGPRLEIMRSCAAKEVPLFHDAMSTKVIAKHAITIARRSEK